MSKISELRQVDWGDFRALGIAIGDGILDVYSRGHAHDREYTNTIVRSVVQRTESAIYRVVADGLYNQHVRRVPK